MTIVTGSEHKLVGLQHIKSSSLSHQKKQTVKSYNTKVYWRHLRELLKTTQDDRRHGGKRTLSNSSLLGVASVHHCARLQKTHTTNV